MEQLIAEMKEIVGEIKSTLIDTGYVSATVHGDNEYVDLIVQRAQNAVALSHRNTEYDADTPPRNGRQEILRQAGVWWNNYKEDMAGEWPLAVNQTLDAYKTEHPNVEHSSFLTIKQAEGSLANFVHFKFNVVDVNSYDALFKHINLYLAAFKTGLDFKGGKLVEDEFIFFISRIFPVMTLVIRASSRYIP